MRGFKKFMETAALLSGGGNDVINTDNDDHGDDDDEWEFNRILEKYHKPLHDWATTSPAAGVVRFNIYHHLLTRTKPRKVTRMMVWSHQGNNSRQEILKNRAGYANLEFVWHLPMEEAPAEEQRAVLAKSDMYKIFGGQDGSAALLYKGDVLDVMIYTCCLKIPDNPRIGSPATTINSFGGRTQQYQSTQDNQFTQKLAEIGNKQLGNWPQTLVEKKMAAFLGTPVSNVRQISKSGRTEVDPQVVRFKLTQTYGFTVYPNLHGS